MCNGDNLWNDVSQKHQHIDGWILIVFLLFSHPTQIMAQYSVSPSPSPSPSSTVLPSTESWVGIENNTVVDVQAQLGYTAFLPCSVRMVGDKQISWIRRRDWHVLTSGVLTYTNDERFSITHRNGADDWTLSIKYIQARDNGTYECQISTGTGIVSQFVNLNVIVPEAFILGSSEYHVEAGSPINLYCIIELSPIPPHIVYWKHDDRQLNYDTERGGVRVTIEHGPKTASRLIISSAVATDSGYYTCEAPNTYPAHVHVFVSQGDKTAAIQRRTSGGSSTAMCKEEQVYYGCLQTLLLSLITLIWPTFTSIASHGIL